VPNKHYLFNNSDDVFVSLPRPALLLEPFFRPPRLQIQLSALYLYIVCEKQKKNREERTRKGWWRRNKKVSPHSTAAARLFIIAGKQNFQFRELSVFMKY
jgi:hypothetical protein